MALIKEKWLDIGVQEKLFDLAGTFTLANNQSTYANVTDFVLNTSLGKSFKVEYSVLRHHQTTLLTGFVGSNVNSIIRDHVGDYIVGGNFTSYSGNAACPDYICKIKKNGNLDTSWGIQTSYSLTVYSIIKNHAGDYIVGGAGGKRLFRVNKDTGLNDTTFNSGGAGANGNIYSITQDVNNKYVIYGTFTTYNGTTTGNLARINSDGTLDTTFNTGGSGPGTSPGFPVKVLALPDGKYLVGGNFTAYNGVACNNYIIRLNANGSIDSNFNSAGTGSSAAVNDVILDSNGKILITGNMSYYNDSGSNNTAVPNSIIRLNYDGTIDTTFNYNVASNGGNGTIFTVIEDSEGRYLIGGSLTSFDGNTNAPDKIMRLNSNGTLDTTFNVGTGTRGINTNNVYTIAEIDNNAYVVGGNNWTSYNGDSECPDSFCQINENGTLRKFYSDYSYLQESGTFYIVFDEEYQKWIIKGETFVGNEAGLSFRVKDGQLQYTSSNLAGTLVTSTLKYVGKYL
jgi:uncharacterized delta-60 repeat protein